MVLMLRLACEEDLIEASKLCHDSHLLTDTQHQQRAQMWSTLLQRDEAVAWAVEGQIRRRAFLLGFGITMGVEERFLHDYLKHPSPCLSIALLNAWQREPQVILDASRLEAYHRHEEGVVLACILGWRVPLAEPYRFQVQTCVLRGLLSLHLGYHLRAWFQEAYQEEDTRFYAHMGQHEFRPETDTTDGKHVYCTTRKEIGQTTGSLMGLLLSHGAPPFPLSRQGLRVAQLALLFGLTNAKIAAALGISNPTVGAHWDAIYERAVDTPNCGEVFDDEYRLASVRGCERRARFLHYATRCPMVLRPLFIGSMPWRLQRNQGLSVLEAARQFVF